MFQKHFTIILALCFSAALQIKAQTHIIDSLKNNIAIAKTPSAEYNALIALCDKWKSLEADTVYKYPFVAKELAVKQQKNEDADFADYYLAACLVKKNKLNASLIELNKLWSKYNNYSNGKHNLHNKIPELKATVFIRTNDFKSMMNSGYEWYTISEKNNDTVGEISASTSIGTANLRTFKYENALQWYYKAFNLMYDEPYKTMFLAPYANTAIAYLYLKKEDSVFVYCKKAIEVAKKQDNPGSISYCLRQYGQMLTEFNHLKEAESPLVEALTMSRSIGDKHDVLINTTALASYYAKVPNTKNGISICLDGLNFLRKNEDSDLDAKVQLFQSLSENYKVAGDFKSYADILDSIAEVKEKIYEKNAATDLAEMQTKYETQKKENTIATQKYDLARKNSIISSAAVIMLAILLSGFVVFKSWKKNSLLKLQEMALENERKTIEAVTKAKEDERQRILADLHDDVGGGLSTIRMVSDLIIKQHEKIQTVNDYALKISGITAEVAQRMNVIIWALNSENDTFLNLCEYIRQYGYDFFDGSLIQFECKLPDGIDDFVLSGLQRKNIFMCVKEALHNILKHSDAKNASLKIAMKNKQLNITVSDNGIGLVNKNKFGNGLSSLQKRMKEIGGSATFESNEGTSIEFKMDI